MTVAANVTRAGPYVGNDITTTFAFAFKVFADTDIRVVETLASTGVETDLVLNGANGYTVVRNNDQDNNPGGTITYRQANANAALPSTKSLTIVGNFTFYQPTDLPNGGPFFARVVENALDRVTLLVKQLRELVGRTLVLPVSTPSNVSAQLPTPAPNTMFGWNETGTALQNVDPNSLATIVAFGTANADIFSGTGAQTNFTLSASPGALANLDVIVGGVGQRAGIDYTWSGGTTLTFTVAPAAGTNNIQARYFRGLPQGIADIAGSTLYSQVGAEMFRDNVDRVVTSVAALQALDKTRFRRVDTLGYYAAGDGGRGKYWMDPADTTSVHNGGTIIVAADGGRWKLIFIGSPTLRQFGAKGDDSTNDSNAILAARDYMIASGNNVIITPGTYLSDPFSVNVQTYGLQASFIGTDRERCIIKRRATGAGAFVTYGSASGTIFQSGVGLEKLTIDGGAPTNGDAFVGYDLVRSNFRDIRFKGGAVACHLYGGISVSFYSPTFDLAGIGFKAEKFTSLAGGGWPNAIRLVGGEAVDNTTWGIWFDHGRMLLLDGVEVEGNGTTLAAAEGGVYVGPNIGTEVSANDTFSIGLVANNACWFEANRGVADVSLNSGINSIRDSNFFSTAAQTTNDIVVNGGRYFLKNVNMSFSKTANVLENSGTVAGNVIESSDIANISSNTAKTTIIGGNKTSTQGGVVPIFAGLSIPYEQLGADTTTAGTTKTVTFPVPFAAGTTPKVFTEVNNGDSSTTMSQIVPSSITNTGFTVRALSITSGSSTIVSSATGYSWRAVGTL